MLSTEDLALWKNSPGTLQVLSEIEQKIQEATDELAQGGLVISPVLEREYCRAVGYIAGLRYIESLMTEVQQDEAP